MNRMIHRKEIQLARVELLTSMWNKFLSHTFDKSDQKTILKILAKTKQKPK